MKADRRAFVGRGLALAGLAGTITGLDSSAHAQPETSTGPSFASFGWEVANLNNNGADVFVEVTSNMTITSIDTDISFMLTSLPANAGFTEVLCRAAVSPGGRPKFYPGDPGASFVSPQSPNFGKTHIYNPKEGLNKCPLTSSDVSRELPSAAKAACIEGFSGTAKAVPFPKPL